MITRVSSGRCGAVSIDLDELITEHYGIRRAEVAPELESLPSIRPQAAAPSSTPSPTTLQRFSRDAQTRLVGAGCGRSPAAGRRSAALLRWIRGITQASTARPIKSGVARYSWQPAFGSLIFGQWVSYNCAWVMDFVYGPRP